MTKKNVKFFIPFLLVFILSGLAWWFFHISRNSIQNAVDVPIRVEKQFNPNVYEVAPAKPTSQENPKK